MTFNRCDGSDGIHKSDRSDSWSPEIGVEDIKSGASSFVGVELGLEYASEGDSNRDKLERVFTAGLGSRDFGVVFGLEDTGDRGSWS